MPSMWRVILPYVIVNIFLIAIAMALVLTGHAKVGLLVLLVDAANLMALRYKMFRFAKRDRR